MKQALIYSLKVWLTGVVISPVLNLIIEAVSGFNKANFEGAMGFILLSIPYSLILSLPCFFLLFLACFFVNLVSGATTTKKICLTIVGAVLAFLPFYLIFGGDDPSTYRTSMPWAVSYCIVIIGSIWFYKLEPRETALINHPTT
jgi:hypothetical protein